MSDTRRKRRSFTPEFKAQIIRLVLHEGKSVSEVAREHDLLRTSVHDWVAQAKVDAGKGSPDALATSEREELERLRRENKRLQMERDILKNFRERSLGLLGEKLPSGYDAGGSEGAAGCFLEARPR